MDIAQSAEAAEAKSKDFKGAPPAIDKVTPGHRNRQPPRQVLMPQKSCYRCGRSNHDEQACRYRRATCHNCGKTGHLASVCRSCKNSRSTPRNANKKPEDKAKWVEMELTDQEDLQLFTLGERASNQITVNVLASGKEMSMELDTGAAVSIISEDTKKSLFPDVPLQHSRITLRTYTGERIEVAGEIQVNVQ